MSLKLSLSSNQSSNLRDTGYKLKIRPRHLPLYWQKITANPGIENYVQRRDWQLVLNSAGIPYILENKQWPGQIYVPPLWANIARSELLKFEEENRPQHLKAVRLPPQKHALDVIFFLVPLLIIHAFDSGWWSGSDWLPLKGAWLKAGMLDNFNVLYKGQWENIFTALTLHINLRHLSGNLLFGSLFLLILARITGPGRAILVTILAGAAGNALSVLAHAPGYRSVGFSTAIFAALGAVAGIGAITGGNIRKVLLAMGSALGLLALLGMEGETTDWAAHLSGLFCGFVLGSLYGIGIIKKWQMPGQIMSGFFAIALITLAWILALHGFSFKL